MPSYCLWRKQNERETLQEEKIMIETLLFCPFCGRQAYLFQDANELGEEPDTWSIECDKCTASINFKREADNVAKAWNTRYLPILPVAKKIGLCLTCQHFDDKGETAKYLTEHKYDIVMSQDKGFPGSGVCAVSYKWAEIEVFGDATATLEVPANFGCIYYKEKIKS